MVELADVLEVINGLCKAYGISTQEIQRIQKQKYRQRGGLEKGVYIKTLSMNQSNPKVDYFRASPDKYPEF